MTPKQHIGSVRLTIRRALEKGATPTAQGAFAWDVSGSCENPVFREVHARPERPRRGKHISVDRYSPKPLWLDIWARCRKCGPCLRYRTWLWRTKAIAETNAAPRTWFGTMTLNDAMHWHVQALATRRLGAGSVTFESLSPEEQFRERVHEFNLEVTRWLKRIRKESGAKLRYCLVAEAHKSGLPHMHILVHEVDAGAPVRHKTLSSQWRWGFSRFKLVEQNSYAPQYVCKYLAKSPMARVRASLRYGENTV